MPRREAHHERPALKEARAAVNMIRNSRPTDWIDADAALTALFAERGARYSGPMDPRVVAQRVDRLRGFRNKPPPDLTAARQLDAIAAEARQRVRAGSAADRAWAEVAPPQLAGLVQEARISRGVMTIKASDAPARYQIDRWLRAGGERQLISRCAASVRRVKVV